MPDIDYVDLFIQLEIICGKYEAIDYIRKSVTFDLLNIHDALENALNYYLANKKESISQINSVVNCFIARLLLADKYLKKGLLKKLDNKVDSIFIIEV